MLLTELQLHVPLKQFMNSHDWLAKAAVGIEIEISNNFFGVDYGFEVNPTVFFHLGF